MTQHQNESGHARHDAPGVEFLVYLRQGLNMGATYELCYAAGHHYHAEIGCGSDAPPF